MGPRFPSRIRVRHSMRMAWGFPLGLVQREISIEMEGLIMRDEELFGSTVHTLGGLSVEKNGGEAGIVTDV